MRLVVANSFTRVMTCDVRLSMSSRCLPHREGIVL